MKDKNEILIYQTEDGKTKVEVVFDGDTVWLPQDKIAELFGCTRANISMHLINIFKENELDKNVVCKDFLHTTTHGAIKNKTQDHKVQFYNLNAILAVGYRVNSLRGVQFRKWASEVLTEYMKKGFVINDEKLKNAGGGAYWHELLERIRDIRSSGKVFYRQILDIYATSIDYDPKAETAIEFFKIMQNKMHFASHGHTASELIFERASAELPFIGLTSFVGIKPRENEITVAKNYLTQEEIMQLNSVVSAYLEFAERQALKRVPMYMKDWITKLDDFLKLSGDNILQTAGKISLELAVGHATEEYKKYKAKPIDEYTQVEKDFIEQVNKTYKMLEKKERPKK